MTQARLLLVAQSPLAREGLRRLLAGDALSVVAEERSLAGALSLLRANDEPIDLMVYEENETQIDDLADLEEDVAASPAGTQDDFRAVPTTPIGIEGDLHPMLSPRETQILKLIRDGLPNKAIARNLALSEQTVKVHIKSLLRKLDAGNRTQAAVWAANHDASNDAGTV
jgi:DNA-binding NarL/FixJ family response regulator